MFACDRGHFSIVELLLNHGVDMDLQDNVSVGGNMEGGVGDAGEYY